MCRHQWNVEAFEIQLTYIYLLASWHSMLRLDATQNKRCKGFDFRFKTFRIKQAIFIKDIFRSHVEASKQKKIEVCFRFF